MPNESKTRLALIILAVAVVMGLFADALLRSAAWGVNLPLWIGCLIAGLFMAKRFGAGSLEFGSAVLIAPMGLFAACFAWRDSMLLQALDLGAIIVAAALVITRQSAPFWAPSLSRVGASVLNLAAHCLAGFAHLVARDIDWEGQRHTAIASHARGAAAGALIALPLLIVFTVLFVRADAAFEALCLNLLYSNPGQHLIPIAIGTWIAGSYLRGVLVPSEPAVSTSPLQRWHLGPTELNVALGLVNALFAVFVAVQIQYLFGTPTMIQNTPGMTFSGYARRGFFELVAVALLVLPLLLAADSLHARDSSKRVFRLQSGLLVLFVFGVMASALWRMRMYQNEYGQTELRWYTTAFMFWLAFVFLLFSLTVLRDLRGLFAMGTVASGFAAIFILHAVNPDRWIAEANLANARAGRRFDPEYFRLLSADAAPAVLAGGNLLPPSEFRRYLDELQLSLDQAPDWRSWNYGRHRAAQALAR